MQGLEAPVDRRPVKAIGRPDAIVDAVNAYLSSWPKSRIRNLQKVDGGWGPFDGRQEPLLLRGVGDVPRLFEAVHRQCINLVEADMAPGPEIMELDRFLLVAAQAARALLSRRS